MEVAREAQALLGHRHLGQLGAGVAQRLVGAHQAADQQPQRAGREHRGRDAQNDPALGRGDGQRRRGERRDRRDGLRVVGPGQPHAGGRPGPDEQPREDVVRRERQHDGDRQHPEDGLQDGPLGHHRRAGTARRTRARRRRRAPPASPTDRNTAKAAVGASTHSTPKIGPAQLQNRAHLGTCSRDRIHHAEDARKCRRAYQCRPAGLRHDIRHGPSRNGGYSSVTRMKA